MGVSVALWNMVRASLRTGLRKEAILTIIRGVIDGVPEELPWTFSMPPPVPPEPKPENHGLQKDNDGGEGNVGDEDEEEEVDGDLTGDKDVC